MILSPERERSEITMISCQDQGRSIARELQKIWYQPAVASTYEVCGAVVGAQDETTVGSRMVGFRSLSCRVFKMGFSSIAILGLDLISDLTRFTSHFSIDRDVGSFFSCVFMCVFNALAFPQRLCIRGHSNCVFDIFSKKKH